MAQAAHQPTEQVSVGRGVSVHHRGGGEALRGWNRDDLHDYFLGECFGWETLEGFGRKRMRPLKRSSALNKQEFSDYLLFLETKCMDMGIVIPEPSYEPA